jgi:predicted extracellular nuclease
MGRITAEAGKTCELAGNEVRCTAGIGRSASQPTQRRHTRTTSTILLNWLATDPTGSADPDFLIIGDLNAYAMEDPIATLKAAGYTNLVGEDAYSYVYFGQAGYLDHALASSSVAEQVTDASIWHINADEPSVLDYNTECKSAGQVVSLYAADEYRSSDHDSVIVDLELGGQRIYLRTTRQGCL